MPGRYYKRYEYPPLRPEDRLENGFGGGPTCQYTYDGKHNWKVLDGDVRADLVMEDFHQAFGFWPANAGTIVDDVAKNHLEASGQVNGKIEFEGKTFTLENATAYRDRSWGVRKWDTMRSHTWIPVIFGPDLSFQVITWYAADKSLMKFGYVLRNDEIIVPKEIDVLSFVEIDGITNRGGLVKLTLASGDVLECKYTPIGPGGVSDHHGYPAVDTRCTISLNNGEREGVGCYEAGFNAMGGTDLPNPDTLIMGQMNNGVFDY